MHCIFLLWLIPGLLLPVKSLASDWPQFLGPTRNGICEGTQIAETWPASGPPVVWNKPVGHGFSGPVVADHKLILFHRLNDQESISCLDAGTGNEIWSFGYPTSYQDDFGFDDGPRATPAISELRLYTFGAEGMLHCLDLGTGRRLWSVNLQKDYNAGKGFFGMACSPLVEGNAVLLNIGGHGSAGIVALDKISGRLLWKSSNDEASYSSPIASTIAGRHYALFLTREGLVGVEPSKGDILFQFPWHSRNRMSVNAATPLVIEDKIFLSASYGTGAVLLQLRDNTLQKVWSGDDVLSNHYATSIALNGFLYGIHGRTDPGLSPRPKLRCIDLKSQKVCWETDSIGAATLTLAGSHLLIMSEKGELVIANATPERFESTARAQVLSSEVRAFPALADGLFYARSKDKLVCLELRKRSEKDKE
jgi:outer membrane protein assembly factor BamB